MIQPFFLHQPNSLQEVVGQDAAIKQLQSYFANFKKGKGLFLYGPTGSGKTSSLYAYAKEQGYDVLELNASDVRSKSALDDFLSKATGQMSLFATKKLILLDEVDGLSGRKDRGAAGAIVDAIKKSSFPIVCTGVDVFDKKFSALKKVCELVEFSVLSTESLRIILQNRCDKEQLVVLPDDLRSIARNAAGDARAALNDLFTFVIVKDSSTDDVAIRKKTIDLAQALIPVLKSTDPSVVFGSFDHVQEDLDKIFLWVDQNVAKEYTKPKDLARAYDVLSLADRFFGRIRRWQYYRFYVYCYVLLSVGIALSKEEKYSSLPRYTPPSRLLVYWQANMQYAKRKTIIEKLAAKTKSSQKTALQDSFPFLLPVLAQDKAVQEELELADDEIAWLKKISV